jgi:hypothetical protein
MPSSSPFGSLRLIAALRWRSEGRDEPCRLRRRDCETADQDRSLDDAEIEWAALWKPLPKVVFSTTLSAVQGTARLASGGSVVYLRYRVVQ